MISLGVKFPMCAPLVLIGLGAGSSNRQASERVTAEAADKMEKEGMKAMVES
jgi:AICAR transformylase/IMP cyclohydrolase PurH